MARTFMIVLGIGLLGITAGLAGQGRPTQGTDPMPDFNPEYFVGTWTFEWTAPDTPIGPGGDFVGTQTYTMRKPPVTFPRAAGVPAVPAGLVPAKFLAHPVLDGHQDGTGPEGALKSRLIIGFDPQSHDAIRVEIPARGAPVVRAGSIGGDLGLTYSFFWETAAMKKNGQTVKVTGRTMILSPDHFRDQIQYSVNDGPMKMLGQPWYERKDKK